MEKAPGTILAYSGRVRIVNISELKAQLSTHIQLVRDGEEVLVCDRNKPVARIVPVRLEDRPEQEQRLVARGVLAPLKIRCTTSLPWMLREGGMEGASMEAAQVDRTRTTPSCTAQLLCH